MFKINGYGNTIEIQGLGADIQDFNTIENLTYNDEVVAYDLSRPLSNLASNDVLLYSFLEKLARQLYNKNGVFQNSLNHQFDFSTTDNIKTINFGALGYKTFVTVSPGIAGFGFSQTSQPGWLIVNKPNIAEAERQLSALLSIKPEDDLEYVKIKYNEVYNRYKMRVVKCTPGGEQIVYDFLNPDFPLSTFDDDSIEGGYKNFVELMTQMYTDTVTTPLKSNLLSDFYYKTTPASLSELVCQPTFHITTDGTYYLKINQYGILECDTTSFTQNDFPLHTFNINGCNTATPTYTYIADNRVFYTDKEIYTRKIDFNTTAETDDVNWIYSDVSGSDTIIKHRIGRDTSDEIMFEYYNGTTATPIAEFKGDLTSTFHGNVFTNANTTLGNLVSADTLTLNSTIVTDLIFDDNNRYIKLGTNTGSATTRTLFLQNDGAGMASLTVEGDITSSNGKLITANTTSYVFDTVATTLHFAGDATTLNVGYDGTGASSTTNINTGALAGSFTKTINIGTAGTTGSTTTIDMGSVIGSGSITLRNYTIGLGTSTANATTVTLGGAITGNTFKVAGTDSGTINYTTDVTTGTVNLFDSLTTGTLNIANSISTGIVNIATNGASTVNIGGTGATIVLGETSGSATLRTSSGVTTANVFDTIATTVNSFGAATTLDIGYDGTAAASTTNINTGALTGSYAKAINIGTSGTTGSTTTITLGSNIGGTITGLGAAINLGISDNSLATTLKLGSAITGNIFKIAGTDSGTINYTTDVTTGTANFLTSLTTGTLNIATGITTGIVNIATAGASTINIGKNDAAAKVYIGGSGAIIDIGSSTGTANIFNTNSTTVNAFNTATTVDLAKAATTFNIATIPAAHQTISIGATAANSYNQTINVGTGLTTTTQTINIGTGLTTGVQTINIGTGASMSAKQLVNVGSSASSTAEFNIFNVTEVDNTTTPTTAALIVGGGVWIKKKLFVAGTSALVGDVTITGDLAVNGGDITTTVTSGTFNLLNSTLTGTLKIGGAATSIEIGNTTASAQTFYIGTAVNGANTAQSLTYGNVTNAVSQFYIAPITPSTSITTGALRVGGGVGIGLKLYVGSDIQTNSGVYNSGITTGALFNQSGVTSTVNIANYSNAINIGTTITGTQTISIGTAVDAAQSLTYGKSANTASYVLIAPTTVATSTSTGALRVGGGVGIGGKLFVGNDVDVGGKATITASTGDITTAGDITINGNDIKTATTTGTFNIFPDTLTGTLNIGTTVGTLGLAPVATTINIGTGHTAAQTITLGKASVASSYVIVADTDDTTAATNGALRVSGGVGIAKSLQVGLAIASDTGIFNSDTTTGALFNTSGVTGEVNIAGYASTGKIFAAASSINIGNTGTSHTINIGDEITTSTQVINIGVNITGAGTQTINVGKSGNTGSTFNIKNNTASTSTSTGALIVTGGVGIGENLYANNKIYSSEGYFRIVGATTTAYLFDTSMSTVDIAKSATTINIGNTLAAAQNIYIGNATDATSTQTIVLGRATNTASGSYVSVAIATDASSTSTGAFRVAGGASVAKKLYVGGDFEVHATSTKFSVASATGNTVVAGTLDVNGAYLKTDDATFYLLTNNSNQIVLLGGTGATGYVKVQSTLAATAYNAAALVVGGGVGVNGKVIANSDIVTNSGVLTTANATSSIFDTVATSLNIGSKTETLNLAINPGAEQTVNIGTTNTGYVQNVNIGTNITTAAQNINIGTALTTGVQTINIGTNASMSAAQAINIGAANNTAGVVKIFNATASTTTTSGALQVIGGVGIGGNLNVGGTTGLTGNTTITGDLAVNGGDITTTAATFNLLNSVATQLNIGTSSATIAIGSASSTVTMGNDLFVTGNQVRIAAKYEFNYDSVTNTLDLVYVG